MKFFVTYCTMDSKLANPLWHACLIVSYWPGEGHKIGVKNAWGFYAAPMSKPGSVVGKLKKMVGLGFDFQGNHGVMKNEELRYLDLGYGLRGVTFEISLEQFLQLKKSCNNIIAVEQQAIAEAKQNLASQGKEPSSYEIYQEEKRQACAQQRPPRLKPFDLRLSLDPTWGVSLNASHTCKTTAIDLLAEIGIAQTELDKLTYENSSMALPRISGRQEIFFLHSVGPRHKHVSERTGKVTFFRSWEDKQANLYWSLPPQMLVTESQKLLDMFMLPSHTIEPVKKILSQLQQVENIIANACLAQEHEADRQRLIKYINDLYNVFAVINSAWDENKLAEKIVEANTFLENIYYAIYEGWDDASELESVVVVLPDEDQARICKTLGYAFVKMYKAYEM